MRAADPRVLLLAALSIVVSIAVAPPSAASLACGAAVAAVWLVASRPRPSEALRAVLLVVLFSALIGLFLPFQGEEATRRLAVSAVKSVLCVLLLVGLRSAAGATRLPSALAGIGVPTLLVSLLVVTTRYLELLLGQARRMSRAIDLRAHGAGRLARARAAGSAAGTLFVRALDRAERVHAAMGLRGFQGTFPAPPFPGLGVREAVLAVASLLAAALPHLAGRWA